MKSLKPGKRITKSLNVIHRSCGPCSACCHVYEINEPGRLVKKERERCEHLGDSGCGIHASRPNTCRAFDCMWLKGKGVDTDRPDQSGVVVSLRPHLEGRGRVFVVTECVAGAARSGRGAEIVNELGASAAVLVVEAAGPGFAKAPSAWLDREIAANASRGD